MIAEREPADVSDKDNKFGALATVANQSRAMYGISRIDDPIHRTHAWRVSLRRRGRALVKNFPDKKFGGKTKALRQAKRHRDALLAKYPPITRKEFCEAHRSNNKSGITGVYCYAKKYYLRDGTEKKCWYWEANWPVAPGESESRRFSVAEYGEDIARQMAIRARRQGVKQVRGVFWASQRGASSSVAGSGRGVGKRNSGKREKV